MALLVLLVLPAAAPPSAANIDIHISELVGGQTGAVLAFPGAGSDSTLNLSLQTGLRAVWAYFNLSGLPFTNGGTDCPESPSLDLGADGDVEWRFNGTGFGSLGHQSLFYNGNATFSVAIPAGGGSNGSLQIRLPVGSDASDASVDIRPSGFSGPSVSVSLDIGADNQTDWTNVALSGPATISGFGSVLTTYLASATPTGVDPFGVLYVDVPFNLSCGSAATLTLSNLKVRYVCVVATANLASKLNALIPGMIGSGNVSVPIKVSVASAGKFQIRDFRILARPPLHSPELADPRPPTSPELAVDENSSLDFSVSPKDTYGNPVSLQWLLDLAPVAGANGTAFTYYTDYASAGRHSVSVTASNGLSEASLTWWVTVHDVNRAPVVDSYSPASPASVLEGSSLQFSVSAFDPDGDQLAYLWRVDGREQPDDGPTFLLPAPYGSAGDHTLDLTLRDSGGNTTNLTWMVNVRRVNVPPVILGFQPPADPTLNEGETILFSVNVSDPNGDSLSYEWVLDGFLISAGSGFNYTPDFRSSGQRELKVLVNDRQFTVGRTWNVTVQDVNHAPSAVIDRPREGDLFLDTDNITLSSQRSTDPDQDPLAFGWYDGDLLLGERPLLNVSLPRGAHRIRLVVEDGKGGRGETSVNLTVRTFKLGTNLSLSPTNPREGDIISVIIKITCEGNAPAENLSLAFFIDGEPAGTQTLPRLEPNASFGHVFHWKAEPGKHDFQVDVGNLSLSIRVNVAPGLPAIVYWLVGFWAVLFLGVCAASVYLFYRYKNVIAKGILLDRGRKEEEAESDKARQQEKKTVPWLQRIRLSYAPYKERPLEIQTTIPEEATPQTIIFEQLTPRRKWLLGRAPQAPAPPPPPPPPPAAAESRETTGTAPPAPAEETPEGPEGAQPASVPEARTEERRYPPPPTAQELPKKPKKRIKDLEDRIHAIEHKGADITAPRRFLSLAKSFWKGGNPGKAEQYLDKSEAKLKEIEVEVGAQVTPVCPKCNNPVDPDWIVCPECESKLK